MIIIVAKFFKGEKNISGSLLEKTDKQLFAYFINSGELNMDPNTDRKLIILSFPHNVNHGSSTRSSEKNEPMQKNDIN